MAPRSHFRGGAGRGRGILVVMRPRLRNEGSADAECGARGVGFADRTIADLAKKQRGVVSRAQLLAVGVTSDAIKHRLRAGRLHRVHLGVYRAGHNAPIHGAREMAAVLACGSGAVVSHLSAATLLQLLPYPAKLGPVDITVAGRDPGSRRGITVHRVRVLDRRDVGSVRGVPITMPARTVLDLAAVLSSHSLERALAEAQVRGLARRGDLVDQLQRNRGRPGTRILRRLLALEGGAAPTRPRPSGGCCASSARPSSRYRA